MPRTKYKKLQKVRTLFNVFSSDQKNLEKAFYKYLGNNKSITLELGCGHGDYSIGLAKLYPSRNFVGVDRKPARIYNGAINAIELKLKNVIFLTAYVERLETIFSESSINEIWIPFPDPLQRRNGMKKRLVHPRFLKIYRKILVKGGRIFLKTDDDALYNYALKVIKEEQLALHKATDNLYNSVQLTHEECIQTKYEKQHIKEGKTIKLIRFSLNS